MQIRADSYQIIQNQALSQLDPRDFSTPIDYFEAVNALVFEWLTVQWDNADRRYNAIAQSVIHVLQAPNVSNDVKAIVYGPEITVRDVDFPAFCRAYNLPEDKLRAVSEGTLREYKGWTRTQRMAPTIFGSPYNPPKAPMSPGEKRKREQEIAREKERMSQLNYKTPTQAHPITFDPNQPIVPSTQPSSQSILSLFKSKG